MSASVFMDAYILMRGQLPFDFYFYYLIYALVVFKYIKKNKDLKLLPKWFFITLVAIIAVSYATGINYNTSGFTMHKQVIGIVFSSVSFYCYLKLVDFQIWSLTKTYLYLSLIVATLGIFEEVFHLIGIHLTPIKGTNLMFYRVYSILGEPYFLAVILLPAFHFYLSHLFQKNMVKTMKSLIRFSIIFVCLIFTFSAAGYMGMSVSLILLLYEKGFFSFKKGRIFLLPLLLLAVLTITLNSKDKIENIKIRFTDTYEAFTTKNLNFEFVKTLNSSTFALYTNYIIADGSFRRNPISGSGLGSHILNYDRTFEDFFSEEFLITFGEFNKQDANSLFLRLMSELGLFGLILFFVFLMKNFILRKWTSIPELLPIVIINHGIFVMIVIRLLRTGNYIGNGFFFFFFLYWATSKTVKNYKKHNKTLTLNGHEPELKDPV